MYTQGSELYREEGAAVGFSSAAGDSTVRWGVACHCVSLGIERYGSTVTAFVNAGILVRILEHCSLGASVSNINGARIGVVVHERLPSTFSLGAAVQPAPALLLAVDACKDLRYPFELRGGIEYRPIPCMSLRCGASPEPSRCAAGVGLRWAGASFDYVCELHPDLGATHAASVSLSFGGR
jgi:hypothetical protein